MAYAALLSLSQILEQTLNRDYSYLILDEKEKIESLLEQLSSLQKLLEKTSPKTSEKIGTLECEIIDAAWLGEDIVESHIMERLLSESLGKRDGSFTSFSQNIQNVVEEISALKSQLMEIASDKGGQDQQQSRTSIPVELSKPAPSGKSTLVGLDGDLREIKSPLCNCKGLPDLQTIALVGMGGIGKTTLAQKVYDDAYVKCHFDTCAWIRVSQDYSFQKILLGLLGYMIMTSRNMEGQEDEEAKEEIDEEKEKIEQEKVEKAKETVYKNLKNKRYLIVMDDVWDTNVWDDVRFFFPNDRNGSRILITTRLENVAASFEPEPHLHHVPLLNEDRSWQLFCEKVFGKHSCPLELEKIGKKIVQHCKGLPLAVVVIGGLLANVDGTPNDWKNVAENLSSLLASNDKQYSNIWSLSYYNLPHHLKGCFLYMGVFPEDFDIHVSILIKLWAAEGFIKPVRTKSLEKVKSKSIEEVAEEYLEELIKRSLIFVSERSSTGKVKTLKIHDLLREFCVSEAKRVMLFLVTKRSLVDLPEGTCVRRLSIDQVPENFRSGNKVSTSLTRSLLQFDWPFHYLHGGFYPTFLRILHTSVPDSFLLDIPRLFNLRYIFTTSYDRQSLESIYECQNLNTFVLRASFSIQSFPIHELHIEPKFWNMAQLMHFQLEASVNLPDPLSTETQGGRSVIILENLHTLSIIKNFRCTEEVVRRIPNLHKLGIYYEDKRGDWRYYCLNNFVRLDKLEALKCLFDVPSPYFLKYLNFPTSLKKLTFIGGELPWEDMNIVGSLPDLQVLKLKDNAFSGPKWEPNKGGFVQLEFLLLDNVFVEHWTADSIHFESLQRLVIKNCYDLKEIPRGVAEISNLRSIELHCCGDSLITSAEEIQDEMGDDVLQILVKKEQRRRLFCLSHSSFQKNQPFPHSLEKIVLRDCWLQGMEMSIVGGLPNLKVLKLIKNVFSETVWEPDKGEFVRLEFLLLEEINIKFWIVEYHFPNLQHLVLKSCNYLMEIPYGVVDIPFLKSIVLHDCKDSIVSSAEKIQKKLKSRHQEFEVQSIRTHNYF